MFGGRVVGPGQPAWEPRDRELALAYRRVERENCGSCGTAAHEWAEDRFAYVSGAWVCPGCENLEQERRNDPNERGTPGRQVFLLPRSVSEAMDDEG